ncbi:hypothetical protein BDN72DRAFT_858086 [Pluteus cervinus]|uniref:Uncharacterized protein n=1 Tax=Pluteus cervinus TaxID=181527 RepID=A0ACD3ASR7_9AGAR|nr:hypothetical protein BDN72DRAFT_858086 [Pluteus cervinus]
MLTVSEPVLSDEIQHVARWGLVYNSGGLLFARANPEPNIDAQPMPEQNGVWDNDIEMVRGAGAAWIPCFSGTTDESTLLHSWIKQCYQKVKFKEGEGAALLQPGADGELQVDHFGHHIHLNDAQKLKILDILNEGVRPENIAQPPDALVANDGHDGEDNYIDEHDVGGIPDGEVTEEDAAIFDEALSHQSLHLFPEAVDVQAPQLTSQTALSEGPSGTVSTELLTLYGLAYYKPLGLLICVSCQEGVPFSGLRRHFKAEALRRSIEVDGKWKQCLIPVDHRTLPPSYKKKFVKSLLDPGHITDKLEIRGSFNTNNWTDDALPGPSDSSPYTPVPGLRICTGCRCSYCGSVYLTRPALRTHLNSHQQLRSSNPCNPEFTEIPVQSLTEANSTQQRWFEVKPLLNSVDVSNSNINTEVPTLDPRRQQQELAILGDSRPSTQRDILPVLNEFNIHQFFESSKVDRAAVYTNFKASFQKLQRMDDYQRLNRLVTYTFTTDLATLSDAPSTVVTCIQNSRQYVIETTNKTHPFAPLKNRNSVLLYIALERHMIYLFIRYVRGPWFNDVQFFKFSEDQLAALNALDALISSDDFQLETATPALYRVFEVLYFPPQTAQSYGSCFDYPIVAYMACRCLTKNGAYASASMISPFVAILLYSMRLRGLHEILKRVQEATGKSGSNSILLTTVKPFVEKYLQDNSEAPFSTIRQWLSRFNRAAANTPPPALARWEGKGVRVGEQHIPLPKYTALVQSQHLELEAFIEIHILFGIATIDELVEHFQLGQLKDDFTNTTRGYGILFDSQAGNPIQTTQESQWFIGLMEENHCLGMHVVEGARRIEMDRNLAEAWLDRVEEAWVKFFPLAHITQGPPCQGTEESTLRVVNTADGKRNAIFDEASGTGGFNCDYHKGPASSGLYKQVLRLLPFRIWVLQWILTRIIRPINRHVESRFRIPRDAVNGMFHAYSSSVYASSGKAWDARKISQTLSQFFEKHFGIKMGLQLYGHFASAIVCKHLTYQNPRVVLSQRQIHAAPLAHQDPGVRQVQGLVEAADRVCGHEPSVSQAHYARLPEDGDGSPVQREIDRSCQTTFEPLTPELQHAKEKHRQAFQQEIEAAIRRSEQKGKQRRRGKRRLQTEDEDENVTGKKRRLQTDEDEDEEEDAGFLDNAGEYRPHKTAPRGPVIVNTQAQRVTRSTREKTRPSSSTSAGPQPKRMIEVTLVGSRNTVGLLYFKRGGDVGE